MRLRPYDAQRDYPCIVSWSTDERTHALWCARLIPYPVTEERFHALLSDQAARWGGAWVMTDERDVPAGFFCDSCAATTQTSCGSSSLTAGGGAWDMAGSCYAMRCDMPLARPAPRW